jgi:H/ACA ribonucleoprotein complex subunit 4
MPRSIPPWMVERKTLVKAEDETDPKYGHKPEERPVEEYIRYGVINLDKPAGPTSHEVAAWVKRILNLKQVGHGGTLEAQAPEKS